MRPIIQYKPLSAPAGNMARPGMYTPSFAVLQWLHGSAAVLHGLQALCVLALIFFVLPKDKDPLHGVFQLTQQLQRWENSTTGSNNTTGRVQAMIPGFFIKIVQEDAFEVDVKLIIVVFFTLACADHVFTQVLARFQTGYGDIAEIGARARLVEYSISASLMAVSIAIETGITDIWTLSGIFFLMWSCMIFGLLAESYDLNDRTDKMYALVAHFAGWIAFIFGFAPIVGVYLAEYRINERKAPDFVHVIVIGEAINFCLFGIAQLLYLVNVFTRNASEGMFLTLSIVAKSLLAWVVLVPILKL